MTEVYQSYGAFNQSVSVRSDGTMKVTTWVSGVPNSTRRIVLPVQKGGK